MLCSARLWLASGRSFPLTPVAGWLPQPPYPLDVVLFGAALVSLAGIALWRRPAPFLKIFLALLAVLAALDQSRWQPWMLEYAVMFGALLALPAGPRAPDACRLLLICTYFYAGLQKLNYGFPTVLAAMLRPMFDRFGLDSAWLAAGTLAPAALLLAAVEGLSGLGLGFRRTRAAAQVCLILMHLSLLVWLGPLALNWNYTVWPWNLASIALLVLLFRDPVPDLRAIWRSHAYAKALAVAFGVLPLLTFAGLSDSYFGFALYSGNVKEGMLYLDPQLIPALPPAVRPFVKPDGVLDIDRWSVSELGVPVYPETRIFQSVGRRVALWLPSGARVRVVELSRPNPFSGQRQARNFDPLTY